jgi:hypothetical protein
MITLNNLSYEIVVFDSRQPAIAPAFCFSNVTIAYRYLEKFYEGKPDSEYLISYKTFNRKLDRGHYVAHREDGSQLRFQLCQKLTKEEIDQLSHEQQTTDTTPTGNGSAE